ncbi:hypothetical protein LKL35_08895 [Streptomyces sp. ET3-23]|uniref:hypothetical protein n=1 Tax=Streptomyces sp. ET3-23 TaxID=2885643 RepID=UPI001D10E340|nr:hypothetical protein [Streptomyces sp. ET3-23]MCC2275538.1 hypothetical protein [Streptomyces sp. ET3-23]
MNTSLSPAEVRQLCIQLSSPGLIRLITEIDDNGPIPPRGLTRTLADLTEHHLRQATDAAGALGLVRARPGAGLDLTASGAELADVYDAIARWARRHAYPAPVANFPGRIQHTLALLADIPSVGHLPSAQALADLAGPRVLLGQWLHAHAQAAQPAEHELAA